MVLYELAPGTRFPSHHHAGAEECYVLSGDFHVEGSILHAGDFHHAESHSDHHESFTEHGCQLLIVAAAGDYA
jgi:anti-sigma factor ChrR (cupin superfamily)